LQFADENIQALSIVSISRQCIVGRLTVQIRRPGWCESDHHEVELLPVSTIGRRWFPPKNFNANRIPQTPFTFVQCGLSRGTVFAISAAKAGGFSVSNCLFPILPFDP
jgi:hypothetical protein